MRIQLDQDILQDHDEQAARNGAELAARGIMAVNLMSAPGSGKTTLLEATIPLLQQQVRVGVIEGDVATTLDAARVATLGVPAVQINTAHFGSTCHLDARMVAAGLQQLPLDDIDLLFIENVGNLICPAAFRLGEHLRALILSITEGEDKPAKYPRMFHEAHSVLINKIDLAPHLDIDPERLVQRVKEVNPTAAIMQVSARTGVGVAEWAQWLLERRRLLVSG